MAGRKKSEDPSIQIAVYPPGSVYQRIKTQAERRGEKPAAYILAAAVQRVETDEAANADS